MTEIITRPVCGHVQLHGDCIKCIAHHLDLIRHVEALIRKQRATQVTIYVTGGKKSAGK